MYYPRLPPLLACPISWRAHNLSCLQPAEVMKPLRLCSRLSRLLKADLRHDLAQPGIFGREKARERIHSQAFLPLNLQRALD